MQISSDVWAQSGLVASVVGASLLIIGCSRGPSAVHVPDFDPQDASQQAMDLYDTNDDGELAEQELAACPGVLYNLAIYDVDNNKKVSPLELEDRLRNLRVAGVGLTKLTIQVRLNDRPLRGADVKLVPETYLGPNVKTAWGKTNSRGSAIMDVRDDDLPASEKGLIGIHYGTYKVVINHPDIQLPAKYNTQSELGYETQRGNPKFNVELKRR